MNRKLLAMLALVVLASINGVKVHSDAAEPSNRIGIFTGHDDVGDTKLAGTVTYDEGAQTYLVSGAGTNMWFAEDEFQFVWKKMTGDFILRCSANLIGEGVDPHRKLGWMIRSSLDTDSPYVDVAVHGDGLTSMQFRREKRANTEQVESDAIGPDVIQLARHGDRYTMSVATFGETFQSKELSDIELGDEVYVGLFVCSHNREVLEQASFRNVRIVVPAADDFHPYRDYIGSHLEVMDVADGNRRILHTVNDSLQAPNWTPDNKALIYNRNGSLYRFDLSSRIASQIPTGFADRNNNDHVLSFDGKMLAISHHSADTEGRSLVYTVPAEGGTPTKVTDRGPSYAHGWSPDGRHLIYTADRDGDYEIYRNTVVGDDEIRLTNTPGLDDGSEYSPDGKTIYFNSSRSGTMQIWQMDADGSKPKQVTDDKFNNWFPHVAPDGKSMVMLSFDASVDPDDHPFYKNVYLRQMSIDGDDIKVIAYVYGGQGTINVPSWSPDSKQIAFVSNSSIETDQSQD